MAPSVNSLFSTCLKVACAIGSVYSVYSQNYLGLLVLVPVFFVDLCMSRFKFDSVANLLKVFLIVQGLLIWYLVSSDFFSKSVIHGALTEGSGTEKSVSVTVAVDTSPVLSSGAAASKKQKESRKASESASKVYPVELSFPVKNFISDASNALITEVVGELFQTDFPDLRYRSSDEVRARYPKVFRELPKEGFDPEYKNPCWMHDPREDPRATILHTADGNKGLSCLPYAYVLGQPKSGTSDLYERMKRHDNIRMPKRKEVRWFTRGEFQTSAMAHEGEESAEGVMEGRRGEQLLGSASSVFSFTQAFAELSAELGSHRKYAQELHQALITVDGGPHTFWWPTQSPDGDYLPSDIPPPQMIREMQPGAKFILTLSDPVKRFYSDYYFLEDNLKPVRPGEVSSKSAQQLHERAALQVNLFEECVKRYEDSMESSHGDLLKGVAHGGAKLGAMETNNLPRWFRAAQMCAHNRHSFAKGGWGRLSIGLYSLYFEKWLEHFPPSQFLVLRLEDYAADPQAHMQRVFDFLGVGTPHDWTDILSDMVFNEHINSREPILLETEQLLRGFYQPYNDLLAKFVKNDAFRWAEVRDKSGALTTLHDLQVAQNAAQKPPLPGHDGRPHGRPAPPHNPHQRKHRPPPPGDMSEEEWDAYLDEVEGDDSATAGDPQRHRPPPPPFDPRQVGPLDPDHLPPPPPPPGTFDHGHGQFGRNGDGPLVGEGEDWPEQPQHPPPPINNLRGHPGDRPPPRQHRRGHAPPDGHEREPAPPMTLAPQNFSLEDLPYPADRSIETFLDDDQPDLTNSRVAATQLCLAAYGMDIPALRKILWEVGVPPDLIAEENSHRNAFHCLALLFTMIDPHPKSQMFAHLRGKVSWMTPHLNPPLEVKQASILSRDVMDSLEGDIHVTARWLARAGVPVDLKDVTGHTALHFAALGGMLNLCRVLLEAGADPNAIDHERRSPLHYAAAYGHAEVSALLLEHKADPSLLDKFDMSPQEIFSNPGPISAADAAKYLNIEQRPVRAIERIIHPELDPSNTKQGWSAGSGGWSTTRLAGFETDMACDVDQYWADEITGDDIFAKYLARNTPVLIRGLLEQWDAAFEYEHAILLEDHGKINVQVSDIPYAEKFGGTTGVTMHLSEYITEMSEHRVEGGHHPWYVFKPHQIPGTSEGKGSLVRYELCPTPEALEEAFEQLPPNPRGVSGKKARSMFVNAQWALGCEGTGAPVHFHNTAWNALVYGAKKWFVYPPHNMIMSNKQIYDYVETDLQAYAQRGVKPLTCVQTAGDVMIIPESWGHGVLNLQDSVAVASESKQALFRITPQTALFAKFPGF